MSTLRPVVVAAGLVAGGLFSSAVLACPGSSSSDGDSTARAAVRAPAATLGESTQEECAYMRSRRTSCCASSLGSRLLGVAAPAGLVAFGLGWLTGGRRRRRSDEA